MGSRCTDGPGWLTAGDGVGATVAARVGDGEGLALAVGPASVELAAGVGEEDDRTAGLESLAPVLASPAAATATGVVGDGSAAVAETAGDCVGVVLWLDGRPEAALQPASITANNENRQT
ncbi:MAG: hypothetical protein M1319_04400 [Chloroflexi bacterium]|nr:hypothetical protein [Chloroflexota bacterium]